MKRIVCVLLLGSVLGFVGGCGAKAEYPDTSKGIGPSAPTKEMTSPKLPDPPKN